MAIRVAADIRTIATDDPSSVHAIEKWITVCC
jgi:hypothetical protein